MLPTTCLTLMIAITTLVVRLSSMLVAADNSYSVLSIYTNSTCTNPPAFMTLIATPMCGDSGDRCIDVLCGNDDFYTKTSCTDDASVFVLDAFANAIYLTVETYSSTDCGGILVSAQAMLADGNCISNTMTSLSVQVIVGSDGTVTVEEYSSSDCSGSSSNSMQYIVNQLDICMADHTRAFLTNVGSTGTDISTPVVTTTNSGSSSRTSTMINDLPVAGNDDVTSTTAASANTESGASALVSSTISLAVIGAIVIAATL